MHLKKSWLLATTGIAASAIATATAAQTGPVQLDEIVITAQRTEENLQRAAVAVTALTGARVSKSGVTELANLSQLAPAIQINRPGGSYNTISLRGVSSTVVTQFGDPAIQVSVDQAPQARATGGMGQFFDLARVEVLKGPQGIFYGRNATGGAVNIISNAPTLGDYSGYLGVDVGNFDQLIVNGAINFPINEAVAGRLAFQSERRDGFYSDGSADANIKGVRGSLRWEPNADINLTLRADYTKQDDRGGGSTAYCAGAPATTLPSYASCPATGRFYGDPWTSISQQQPQINPFYPVGPGSAPGLLNSFANNEFYSASAELNWNTFGGTVSLIPAFHHDTLDTFTIFGWNLREQVDHDQYSIELRFASDQSKPIRFLVGGFYFHDVQDGGATYDQRFILTPFSTPPNFAFGVPPGAGFPGFNTYGDQNLHNEDTSWAGFGNVTWSLTDAVRLSAGVRYTWEEKSTDNLYLFIDASAPSSPWAGVTRTWGGDVPNMVTTQVIAGGGFPTTGTKDWSDTSYRLAAEWDWREGSLLYASYATGFKSGGFYLNQNTDPLGISYRPEKVKAWTVGSKNQFLNNRLRLNLELFHYDYTDQQVGALLNNSAGKLIFPSINVGRSTIQGAELELEFLPFENTRVSGDIQYLDATYDTFQVPNAFLGPAGAAGSRCRAVVNTKFSGAAFANDCSGMQMLWTPEWTVQFGVEQTFPLGNGANLVASVDTRWEDERETNSSYFVYSRAPATWRSNASLTYNAPDDRWSVSAYVRNIEDNADADTINTSLNQSGMIYVTLRPPRQYGLRLKVNFGGPTEPPPPPPSPPAN